VRNNSGNIINKFISVAKKTEMSGTKFYGRCTTTIEEIDWNMQN
jgi:hypothetical protein